MKNIAPSPLSIAYTLLASAPVDSAVRWGTKMNYPKRKELSNGFKVGAIVITTLVLLFILLYTLGCYYSGNWCFHAQHTVNQGDVELGGGAGVREEELQNSSSSSD